MQMRWQNTESCLKSVPKLHSDHVPELLSSQSLFSLSLMVIDRPLCAMNCDSCIKARMSAVLCSPASKSYFSNKHDGKGGALIMLTRHSHIMCHNRDLMKLLIHHPGLRQFVNFMKKTAEMKVTPLRTRDLLWLEYR